jgi:hypothetical protein
MVAAWLRKEDNVMSMSGEPTWRTLVEALRKVGLNAMARDIQKKEKEVDEQTLLRDDVIFRLKQQMAIQQQRIADLECERKGQLSQVPISRRNVYTVHVHATG